MPGRGFDVGTFTLVSSKRKDNDKIEIVSEINAFIEVPLDNPFTYNMLEECGVPLIKKKKDNMAYAIGEAAVNIAYTWDTLELKRPMAQGCVNPKEKSAFSILKTTLHSLLGEVDYDGEVVAYSVPANAINQDTDADYHRKVLEAIFQAYEVNDKKITPIAINEALALVYAELGKHMLTGIGVSCGAGMVNVCYANMSVPVFEFALVNSGDWIDDRAAKATGETPTVINQVKKEVSLLKDPEDMMQRAIQTQYKLMIENTVKGIKKGFESSDKKLRSGKPVNVVVAGGTSLMEGFDVLFKEQLMEVGLPVEIGEVWRPKDALNAVARGCLIAAEKSSEM